MSTLTLHHFGYVYTWRLYYSGVLEPLETLLSHIGLKSSMLRVSVDEGKLRFLEAITRTPTFAS